MDIIVTLDVLSKLLSSNSFRVSNSATVIHSLFFPQGCFLAGVALSPNVVELMAVILLLALGPGWVGPHSTFASVGLLACWCQCCLTLLDPGSSESEETPTDLFLVSKKPKTMTGDLLNFNNDVTYNSYKIWNSKMFWHVAVTAKS